jgi:hypothetical protein
MATASGLPMGSGVRERLRAAQRAETEAVAEVQKAVAAETNARARLEEIIFKQDAELSKATRAVHAAQASVVSTSGLERAAALLDVSLAALRSAVKETSQDARDQSTSNKTPVATTAPTTAPTKT